MIVKLKDVVNRVNNNIDRFTTDIQYYLGKGHGECGELAISEHGDLKKDVGTLGFKFHFGFKPGDTLFFSRSFALRKAGMATYEGICSDSTYILRSKDEAKLLSKYLPIVLQSDVFWEYCDTHHTGGVNFLINWSTLADYEFDLPCLEEQQRISDRIWSAYNLKESYKKLLIATDELVKSQFIEMFSDVPKVGINTLVDTIWGSSPDSKTYNDTGEGVPFYQGKTEFGDLYINAPVTFCTAPVKMAKANAILMSVRAPVGAVNIATQDCCIGRGLASITPKEGKSTTMFIYYALKYMEEDIDRLGTGSTFKAINKESYAKIQMPNAEISDQTKFVSIAEQADKSKFELRKSIDAIDAVIKSLING